MNIVLFATTPSNIELNPKSPMGISMSLQDYNNKLAFLNDIQERFEASDLNPYEFILLSPHYENAKGEVIPLPEETKLVSGTDVSGEYWESWQSLNAKDAEQRIADLQASAKRKKPNLRLL